MTKQIEYVYVVINERGVHAIYELEKPAIEHAKEINGTVHRRLIIYAY